MTSTMPSRRKSRKVSPQSLRLQKALDEIHFGIEPHERTPPLSPDSSSPGSDDDASSAPDTDQNSKKPVVEHKEKENEHQREDEHHPKPHIPNSKNSTELSMMPKNGSQNDNKADLGHENHDTSERSPADVHECVRSACQRLMRRGSRLHRVSSYQPEYHNIEEHGVIGNMRTAALISVDCEVVWYCYPYFDSPSVFASILDRDRGGYFAIQAFTELPIAKMKSAPPDTCEPIFSEHKVYGGNIDRANSNPSSENRIPNGNGKVFPDKYQPDHVLDSANVAHKQLYHSDTNVLISRFLAESGVGNCTDFMPVGKVHPVSRGWLARELEVVRGSLCFQIECKPAFNYGRDKHMTMLAAYGARFLSPSLVMEIRCSRHLEWELTEDGLGCRTQIRLTEGEKEAFIFSEFIDKVSRDRDLIKHNIKEMNEAQVLNIGLENKIHSTETSFEEAKNSEYIDLKSDPQDSTGHGCTPGTAWVSKIDIDIQGDSVGNEKADKSEVDPHASDPHPRSMNQRKRKITAEEKEKANKVFKLDCYTAPVRRMSRTIVDALKRNTISYWRKWISGCTYTGRWREEVYRSALVLKLMTFEETGAIVAAITTSLPEELGGERNWDYRYCWLRDSSFVLYAFLKLGFRAEAIAFMRWISKRCEGDFEKDGTLQIMYGLRGEKMLEEKILDLSGYKNSRPVRIGNGAYNQCQLDIYGELLDTVYLSNKHAEPISFTFWVHVRKMVDWVCAHWKEKDHGIWEAREERRHYVYSKVMAWVAVDRGIRLAERRSLPTDLVRWHAIRNEIYEEIQTKGWSEERKAYVQHYDSQTLDASVLIMPMVFFCSPTDPKFVSTLQQILSNVRDGGLVSDNLVFRYDFTQTPDGLSGEEGTFSICTFWACESAARLGYFIPAFLERGRFMFEKMLGYANHLGLFSEEIGKRGEHLGNTPQALTHLALISAALNLNRALDLKNSPHVTGVR